MILVIDASITIAWIVADEQNDYAEAALASLDTDRAVVPGIWNWEISNTLIVLERKGRLSDALAVHSQLVRFPIDLELIAYAHDPRATRELELARKHQLSVYDAAYLAVAEATSHPLATLDLRLANAARREGIYYDP